ncbi:MAG: RtcB family protein [Phycisphaerae bacterium]
MKKRELRNLGLSDPDQFQAAFDAISTASRAGIDKQSIRRQLQQVAAEPEEHLDDPFFAPLAARLIENPVAPDQTHTPRSEPARWTRFGRDLDANSVEQMANACKLPVAVAGALMPDAHLGYGLPIGGVLACDNAVIPYAVGVDIACRMKMTVLDLPTTALDGQTDRLARAIERETAFGVGAEFKKPRSHPVMDEDWSFSPVTERMKHKARSQLGSSGSGNHFVEFGLLSVDDASVGLARGEYLALLSHSGSRGPGNEVAKHYSKLASQQRSEMPKELSHLAWLDMDSDAGREYWQAMQLMGRFASANHELIHHHIARHLGAEVLLDIENHHNFAWIETHDGRDVVVHRKGATPAGRGTLGIIPGSMASPGFVVRGKGNAASLQSASHGAGRVMSRRQARKNCTWSAARKLLAERNVELLSAGLDEVPMVYKDIHEVMAAQKDLVQVLARFDPRLVKMAPGGPAED